MKNIIKSSALAILLIGAFYFFGCADRLGAQTLATSAYNFKGVSLALASVSARLGSLASGTGSGSVDLSDYYTASETEAAIASAALGGLTDLAVDLLTTGEATTTAFVNDSGVDLMSDVFAVFGREGTLLTYEQSAGSGMGTPVTHGNTCTNFRVADADIAYGSLVEISTSGQGSIKTAGTNSTDFIGVMYLQHDLDPNVDPVPVGSEAWIVTHGAAMVHVATESEIVTGDLLWSVGGGLAGKAGTITTLSDYRRIVGRVLRGYDGNNTGAYMPVMLGK